MSERAYKVVVDGEDYSFHYSLPVEYLPVAVEAIKAADKVRELIEALPLAHRGEVILVAAEAIRRGYCSLCGKPPEWGGEKCQCGNDE
jgi:hypothetical protein